jgi:hypothetical protein
MILQAKQRLLSFKALFPEDIPDTKSKLAEGNRARKSSKLKWVKDASEDPSMTVGYIADANAGISYYIYKDNQCVGNFMFDTDEGLYQIYERVVEGSVPEEITKQNWVVPHVFVADVMQGSGLASFVWVKAIQAGLSLVSDSHTAAAGKLWERVAQKTGAHDYWYDPESCQVLDKPTKEAVRLLTKAKL